MYLFNFVSIIFNTFLNDKEKRLDIFRRLNFLGNNIFQSATFGKKVKWFREIVEIPQAKNFFLLYKEK